VGIFDDGSADQGRVDLHLDVRAGLTRNLPGQLQAAAGFADRCERCPLIATSLGLFEGAERAPSEVANLVEQVLAPPHFAGLGGEEDRPGDVPALVVALKGII
jgi:hypothetical protein